MLDDISRDLYETVSMGIPSDSAEISNLHENGEKRRYFIVSTNEHRYYRVTIEELFD